MYVAVSDFEVRVSLMLCVFIGVGSCFVYVVINEGWKKFFPPGNPNTLELGPFVAIAYIFF